MGPERPAASHQPSADRGRCSSPPATRSEVTMTSRSRRIILVAGLGVSLAAVLLTSPAALAVAPAQSTAPAQPMQWYKGNTHTHTINNGGDSTPEDRKSVV